MVKEQGGGPNSERVTLQEFANLRRLKAVLDAPIAHSVPDPLLALPGKGILLTSKVPGVPVSTILKRYANRLAGPFCTSRVTEIGRKVGSWLLSFQNATRADPVTICMKSYLADIEFWLSECERKGFEGGREILREASKRSVDLDGKIVSASARHGDFIAQNVLIQKKKVGVVDFEAFSERDAIYDDVGMFLGYILILRSRAIYSRQALDAARLGFLNGFLAGASLDQALLTAYILKGAVRIIGDGPLLTKNSRDSVRKLQNALKRLASGVI